MCTHLHMSIKVKWYGPSTLSLDKMFGFQFLDLHQITKSLNKKTKLIFSWKGKWNFYMLLTLIEKIALVGCCCCYNKFMPWESASLISREQIL